MFNIDEIDKIKKVIPKLEKEVRPFFNIYSITGGILSVIGIVFWITVGVFDFSFGEKNVAPSILINPFDNLGEKEDDFYAYSLSVDIISQITNAGLIRVASLKQIEELNSYSIEKIANRLEVRYIVTGALWKMNDIFQLSVEIFDTQLSKVILNHRIEKFDKHK